MSIASHAPHGSRTRQAAPTTAEAPVEPTVPLVAAEPPYELVDLDRYVIQDDGPVGYVDVVPPVFVCHLGHPYARAVEIAQLHDFHTAVQAVIDAHQRDRARRSRTS